MDIMQSKGSPGTSNQDEVTNPGESSNRDFDCKSIESIDEKEDENTILHNYLGWTASETEVGTIWKRLDASKGTLLGNAANSFHRLSSKPSSYNSSKSGKASQTSKQRHSSLANKLALESHGSTTIKFDVFSIVFLVLAFLSLVVCPAVSLAKSSLLHSPSLYTTPLMFKHAFNIVVHIVSIAVGIGIFAYGTVLPILQNSVFPLVETERLCYSDTLLMWLHRMNGASLAYDCIGHHQCMRKKFG